MRLQFPAREAGQRTVLSLGVALASWLLYLACLSPTVTYDGDCGELIAASYRLGIAHPSGYPFYLLLGRLWSSILPFGEVAWRFNLLGATLGAASVGLIAATAHRALWSERSPKRAAWCAGGGALLLAGFYYFGSQNVVAEVYSLNAFFLALLLWHAVSWLHAGDWRHLYALALTFGLSLTAHLSGLFLAPALLLLAIVAPRRRWKPFFPLGARRFATALALCAAGFALTFYMPLRSRLWPDPSTVPVAARLYRHWPLDWGHPDTFARWKKHASARQYNSLLFAPKKISILGREVSVTGFSQPLSRWPRKVATLLEMMSVQLLLGAPFVVIGLVAPLLRRTRAPASTSGASAEQASTSGASGDRAWLRAWLAGSLALSWALNVGIQINYDVNDLVNFFFPAYLAQAIWLAMGLYAVGGWVSRATQSWNPQGRWRTHTLLRLSLAGLVAVQWGFFFGSAAYRGDTRARDRALEIAGALEQAERESGRAPVTYMISNDLLWTFWYAQYVLGRAENTRTPWGVLGSRALKTSRQDEMVAKMKAISRGPVTVLQWNDDLDRRFPLVPLPDTTMLALASDRRLPIPAAPLPASTSSTSLPPNSFILSGRAQRTALTRMPWKVTAESYHEALEEIAKENPQAVKDARAAGVPALKRGLLCAFDLDFARPPWPAVQIEKAEGAEQIGWAQVLVARAKEFQDAPPPPRTIHQFVPAAELPFVHTTDPQIAAWTNTRRLVVPAGSQAGQKLRAMLHLQAEADAVGGLFKIFVRLVRDPKDATTPWQYVDLVEMTHR
jgi:hypothetical protein